MVKKSEDLKQQLGNHIKRGQMAQFLPPEMRDEEDRAAVEKIRLESASKRKSEAVEENTPAQTEPVSSKQGTTDLPAAAATAAGRKSSAGKKTDDRKVPFMTYLDRVVHKKFEHLYLETRTDARSATGKALSQSEMVEALIKYADEKTDGGNAELSTIAEDIINTRTAK